MYRFGTVNSFIICIDNKKCFLCDGFEWRVSFCIDHRCTRSNRGHVTTLILKLALHSEVSLQTLAFRLDYSDFYKRGDAKLHEPLTYQHKRLSEIGINLAKVCKHILLDNVYLAVSFINLTSWCVCVCECAEW